MIYTLVYIIVSAGFGLILHSVGKDMPPGLLIFLCAINTMLFFHLINIFSLKKIYTRMFKQDWSLVLGVMGFIALSTSGAFLLPIYFMPAEFLFSYVAGITLLGSIDNYRKNKTRAQLIQVIALILLMALFYVMIYSWFYATDFYIFVASTLFVSFVTYRYFVLSYKLYQNGLSSVNILTVRFWPLAILSGIWSLNQGYFSQLSLILFFKILLVSIVVLILPVFISQKSIEKSGPDIHAIFMGFIPLITLIGEIICWGGPKLTLANHYFLVLSVLLAIIICMGKIRRVSKV